MSRKTARAAFFAALLLVCLVAPSQALIVYTDEATFASALGAYHFDDFMSPRDVGTPIGFTFTASAASGLYPLTGAISTNASEEALHVDFTGLPVTAFGGIFWPTDVSGNNAVGDMTLTVDGTSLTISQADSTTFRGFLSAVPFSSVDIATNDSNYWPTLTDFYVGQAAVPVPASLLLIVGPLAGLFTYRRMIRGGQR